MHAALQLAPVLAAEKSKVAFYVAGGVLVLWALTLSMAIGMREPKFPDNLRGQRAVSAVTIALVAATLATAVITSGGSAAPAAAKSAAPQSTASSGGTPAPAETATTATPAPAPAASKLQIAADQSGLLKFDTKALTARAGTVTITMANASPLEHDVTIAQGSTVLGATPKFTGGTRTLTLKLKPGSYVFYCSVPGHRQAGMEGTLTVQ
jgi:uncharacterized cupredoxin-like copper-binding protein